VNELRMRGLMKEAKTAGMLEVARAPRERLDGVMTPIPVYRFDVEVEDSQGNIERTG